MRGDTTTAVQCVEEALALAKKTGNGSTISHCLMTIAHIHFCQGTYLQAKAHYEEACRCSLSFLYPHKGTNTDAAHDTCRSCREQRQYLYFLR